MRAKDAAHAVETGRQDGDGDTTSQSYIVAVAHPLVRASPTACSAQRFVQNSQNITLKVKPDQTQPFSLTGPLTILSLWKAEQGAVLSRVRCTRSYWLEVQPIASGRQYNQLRPQRSHHWVNHAAAFSRPALSLCQRVQSGLSWPQTQSPPRTGRFHSSFCTSLLYMAALHTNSFRGQTS